MRMYVLQKAASEAVWGVGKQVFFYLCRYQIPSCENFMVSFHRQYMVNMELDLVEFQIWF